MILPFSFEPDIRALSKFLTRNNESGYTFASSKDLSFIPSINREIIRYGAEESKQIGLLSFNLEDISKPVVQIKEAIKKFSADALIIDNLDLCIRENEQFLLTLNFSREELFAISKPLLFWISEINHIKLNQFAKDLFSQRRISTVWFSEINEISLVERFAQKYDDEYRKSEDFGLLTQKINLLIKQLTEAEEKEEPPSRITDEIVLPLIRLYSDIGLLDKALDLITTFKTDLKDKSPYDLILLGDICLAAGNINAAFDYFNKSQVVLNQQIEVEPQNENDKINLGVVYERLGKYYQALGQFDQALKFFELEIDLFKELYEANPRNENLKNGLAISYSKLGDIYQALGQFDQALKFFELRSTLGKELYEANPRNENLKNGLAISYEKLGDIYQALGQFDQALKFFELEIDLFKELYEANPRNIQLLEGLAVSYSKLGELFYETGKKEEGLQYLSEFVKLTEQLLSMAKLPKYQQWLDWCKENYNIEP